MSETTYHKRSRTQWVVDNHSDEPGEIVCYDEASAGRLCGILDTAHTREAALVAALREIVRGAPTEEPEIYDGDNRGDSYSSGWNRAAFFAARTARAAIDSTGETP